jgi:hypothetical protein
MKIYTLDAVNVFAGEVEINPTEPLPLGVFVEPPTTTGEQVAQWIGDSWVVLALRPAPPPRDPLAYQAQRAAEYPPITDYIDGIVKGDQAQVQAYIDACLAVKAKYPKP